MASIYQHADPESGHFFLINLDQVGYAEFYVHDNDKAVILWMSGASNLPRASFSITDPREADKILTMLTGASGPVPIHGGTRGT